MIGFFVSVDKTGQNVFVYKLKYHVHGNPSMYNSSGMFEPTTFEIREDHLVMKKTPGYHLWIEKLDNSYFERFIQSKDPECNGWMQTRTESPYIVTRFKHDRMFLLLAMDLETKPINVKKEFLTSALQRRGLTNANIKYIN